MNTATFDSTNAQSAHSASSNTLASAADLIGRVSLAAIFMLAGFSVLSGLIFHFNMADQTQFILFFKNIAMAGGFLVLAANGAGAWSLDGRRS